MRNDYRTCHLARVHSPNRPTPAVVLTRQCVSPAGAYGTVYCARDLNNPDRVVALKKIRITLNEDGVPGNAVREIALLKQLERFEHPNIVR